ncbi:hypothetical protein BU24DRAFT_368998 [Aaosphaeria arxii CBS 175.79]|uniref:CUE domain-containing protein n=1 Tax=Aaosphaeria arxii CBS 175.79 TaxID=1450172 RepID=A0A6A5XYT6_9PLEO|nr:uncharacterized protein BU24DRAFT_368998 [Aaosphaeria arxii CBS 175.79]KAF2018468.1 hypothetical protein BU24DRAFT_368998 [Aaosphaeria arxii CBS 175.79]
MAGLPPFTSFPTAEVRNVILPTQWDLYVESTTSLTDLYLQSSDQDFLSAVQHGTSLQDFLTSFFHELARNPTLSPSLLPLRRKAFVLLHRIWSSNTVPTNLLEWSFVSNVCRSYPKNEQRRSLLKLIWSREGSRLEKSLQLAKDSAIKLLDSKNPDNVENILDSLGPLLKYSTEAGEFMLTGSDFFDSLGSAYPKVSPNIQRKLVITAYLGLTSLVNGPKPKFSLLSDYLYGLKTSAEQAQKRKETEKTYVADLVTNTPLVERIRAASSGTEGARLKNIVSSLATYHQEGIARPKKIIRRKVDKGKGKATGEEHNNEGFGEFHVHRMSLVTQVQDLFPDLGPGFVIKLLDEYNDNVELVTAHLLEDSLPPHLATADRSEPLPQTSTPAYSHLPPRSTPPPAYERRNKYDNDELDNLTVDTSRLHIGRKNQQLTADNILSDRSNAPKKSSILAALAAFDLDDDERDDTYDVEDVGGTIDSAAPGPDGADADLQDKNEEALFRAFAMSADVFGRDAETRRGKARAILKSETGMTDEAIEGWAVMMTREPRRLRRLEAKYATFSGQQRELASTAYRGSPAESGDEGKSDAQRGGRGGHSGRGRGRGRGRGGGNVAGSNEEKSTQVSRQRKEANKGSRANHNRRDQRARKMARGGLAG